MPISQYYKPIAQPLGQQDDEEDIDSPEQEDNPNPIPVNTPAPVVGPQLPQEKYPWVDGPDISAPYDSTQPPTGPAQTQDDSEEEDDSEDEGPVGPSPLVGPVKPPPGSPPPKPPTDLDRIRSILNRNQAMAARMQQDNALQQMDINSQKNYNTLAAVFERAANQIGNFKGKTATPIVAPTVAELNQNLDSESKQAQQNLAANQALINQSGQNEFDLLKGRGTELGNQAKELGVASEADKADPNSEYSKQMRDFLTNKLNYPVGENVSAAQLEKIMPGAQAVFLQARQQDFQQGLREDDREFRDKELKQRLQTHSQDLAAQREALAANMQMRLQEQAQTKNTKRFETLNKQLTDELASSRTTVGRASNGLYSADKIDALLRQTDAQGGKATPQQLAEIATAMDSMIKGGASTVSGVEHLLPKTAVGRFSDLSSYIQSKPTPVELKEFLDLMRDTVHREKEVSQKTLGDFKKKTVVAYKDLAQSDPETWNNIMQAHGLDNTGANTSAPGPTGKVSIPPGGALPP